MQIVNELPEVIFGYNEKVIIYPQMMSAEAEESVRKDFADLADSDTDKQKKEFNLLKQFLIDASAKMPELLVMEQGKAVRKPLVEGAETIAEAVEKYFAECNIANYRVVSALYWQCKSRFQPTESF